MNWTVHDYLQWDQSKEYIDTVIIPLIPIRWGSLDDINDADYMNQLIVGIEREYRGRIIASLPFTYGNESIENRWERLNEIAQSIKETGVSHVIFLTCDESWKKQQEDVLYIRPISLQGMKEELLREIIKVQVETLQNEFTKKWN
ncbi:MAG: DUF2487 family protein [Bacillaceae bacterium]